MQGRKAAAPNIGGLAWQGKGPSGLIANLSAANMSAPSEKGIQASANAVAPTKMLCGNGKQFIDVE